MQTITCEHCGASYTYEEQKISTRDKDTEKCQVCGNELMSWNGGYNYYNFQLIDKVDLNENKMNIEIKNA